MVNIILVIPLIIIKNFISMQKILRKLSIMVGMIELTIICVEYVRVWAIEKF